VRPISLSQFWIWINWSLPGRQVHFVGLAAICWTVWKTRNNVCFEGKRIKSPTEIICLIGSTLTYWTGLQKDAISAQLEQGAEVLEKAALHFHQKEQRHGGDNRMAIV